MGGALAQPQPRRGSGITWESTWHSRKGTRVRGVVPSQRNGMLIDTSWYMAAVILASDTAPAPPSGVPRLWRCAADPWD